MKKQISKNKIVAILGSTASGKTGLAVKLALKFNGEIVSADSRQVYKGMDIGTGKDLKEYQVKSGRVRAAVPKSQGDIRDLKLELRSTNFKRIPYHLIDVVSPKNEFNLAKYQKKAYRAIDDILRRGKLPIVVGGTGLYLQAIVDGYKLPSGKPDKKLRKELEELSIEKLFGKLKRQNKKLAERLNESDRKNKRRLIRYLEIASQKSKVKSQKSNNRNKFDTLILGISIDREKLRKRIYLRLNERLEKENMVGEVEGLHNEGLSWKRLESFGLEYKYVALYLQGKLEYEQMVELLNIAIKKFSNRQMTWYRRWERQGKKIVWIQSFAEARKLIKHFLKDQ